MLLLELCDGDLMQRLMVVVVLMVMIGDGDGDGDGDSDGNSDGDGDLMQRLIKYRGVFRYVVMCHSTL
jgi:hypothetical protein